MRRYVSSIRFSCRPAAVYRLALLWLGGFLTACTIVGDPALAPPPMAEPGPSAQLSARPEIVFFAPKPGHGIDQGPPVSLRLPAWQWPQGFPTEDGLEIVQHVSGHHGDQGLSMTVRLSLTPHRLTMAALDLMGRRLFTLEWSRHGVFFERAPNLPEALPPENILFDILVAYWPLESLHAMLKQSPVQVVMLTTEQTNDQTIGQTIKGATGPTLGANTGCRVLRRRGTDPKPVMRFCGQTGVWSGRIAVTHHFFHYRLQIMSTELDTSAAVST